VATSAALHKRHEVSSFIEEVLIPEPAVRGVVVIGSIATGHARPESDIDAVLFLDPFDFYMVPAVSYWRRSDGSFHSIFSVTADQHTEGLFLDIQRYDLRQWADPGFVWPEGRRAELAEGWLAFDRNGAVARLIADRTAYLDDLRIARLDDAIVWIDQHLGEDKPEGVWESLGPAIAHDRLNATYEYLVQALFAYHRRWRPWRNREMSYLEQLPWLPAHFAARVLPACNAPSLDRAGYDARVEVLRGLFNDLLTQLVGERVYTEKPISEAFVRIHTGPGWSWDMEEWNIEHHKRKLGGISHG
jgi:Nucleotidyltransferase domain